MLQILLIHPGCTEYDQQGRVQGTLDIPLCEDGRQQVEALIGELGGQPIAAIYSSPSQPAQQTAETIAAAHELRVKTLDKLTNLDHGLWQGMLVDDVKTKQPKVYRQWLEQPENVCPPHGETVVAAKQRVQAALAKLVKKHRTDEIVALVVPEPLASIVRHVLRHDELGDLWHSADEAKKWELIEISEAVAARS